MTKNNIQKMYEYFCIYLEDIKDLVEVKPENQLKVWQAHYDYLNKMRKLEGKEPLDFNEIRNRHRRHNLFRKKKP